MSLQNRVLPDGRIVAQDWRGQLMGNRGGRIHDPATQKLTKRKWASRRWISCVLDFKERQRQVMGEGYTELFFLDDVSALAAGHRPCFECRRTDANRFAIAMGASLGMPDRMGADQMDRILHKERLETGRKLSRKECKSLPIGSLVRNKSCFYAIGPKSVLKWTEHGYMKAQLSDDENELLTPPSMIAALASGYQPVWHPSAAEVN